MKIDGKTILIAALAIGLLLTLMGAITYNPDKGLSATNPFASKGPSPTWTPGPTQGSTTTGATPLPLYVTTSNALAGSLDGSTVTIRNNQGTQLDSFVTDSKGKGYTSQTYTPGQELWITQSANSSYVTRCYDVTVPSTATNVIGGGQAYPVSLQTLGAGNYSMTGQISGSTTQYATGQTLNFTALNTNSITLTLTVTNTGASNTGWWSSYDNYNNLHYNVGYVLSTTGSSVNVAGISSVPRGSTTCYYTTLPDGYPYVQGVQNAPGLSKITGAGSSTLVAGQTTFTMTVGKGTLAAGSTQAFTGVLYSYFDPDVFRLNGNQGSLCAQLGTWSVTFAA